VIPASALAYLQALESAAGMDNMPLKPRVRVKAKGRPVFLGKDFEAAVDASGDIKIKPKKKHRTLNQEYASRNKKRFKRVAK